MAKSKNITSISTQTPSNKPSVSFKCIGIILITIFHNPDRRIVCVISEDRAAEVAAQLGMSKLDPNDILAIRETLPFYESMLSTARIAATALPELEQNAAVLRASLPE